MTNERRYIESSGCVDTLDVDGRLILVFNKMGFPYRIAMLIVRKYSIALNLIYSIARFNVGKCNSAGRY